MTRRTLGLRVLVILAGLCGWCLVTVSLASAGVAIQEPFDLLTGVLSSAYATLFLSSRPSQLPQLYPAPPPLDISLLTGAVRAQNG